jgi:hypothetical protein
MYSRDCALVKDFWFVREDLYNFLSPINSLIFLSSHYPANYFFIVRFEVFMAVTMKNGVLWDVLPCGSYKSRRFGGT